MRNAVALGLFSLSLGGAPASAQSPALWSVSDADTTIYMFGSVHATAGGPAWFDGAIRAAYEASSEIAIENASDPTSEDPVAEKYAKSRLPLRQNLNALQRSKLEAVLATLGAKRSLLDKYKPWYANLVVGTSAMAGTGFSTNTGVESTLRRTAEHDGKALVGMETREHQYAVLDSIPIAAQVRQIDMTMTYPATVRASAETRVRCWQIGDLACISAAVDRDYQALPEVREAMLVQRSGVFARWIAERMKQPGTVFVAVGLDHFVGKGSLIEQLSAMGLVVKSVKSV